MSGESSQSTVPVVCPKCDTRTEVAIDEVADTIERHNDARHGGDSVACVDPAIRDALADLVAEELDLL